MAENSLKKFVFLGCQSPDTYTYQADQNYDDLAKIEIKLDCLDKIITDIPPEKLPDVFSDIAKHPLSKSIEIALTLAICAKSDNETVKRNVLKSFSAACSNPKTVLYFIKCLKHVQNIQSASKNIKLGIWGAGVRRVLTEWYGSLDANTLARLLIEGNTVKWTHKDIIKQIHFKPSSPEIDSVIKYFGFGKAEAKNALSDDLKILANKVEEVKSCKDELRAAALFEELKLSKYHMPHALFHSPKFWSEHIRSWDLVDILKHLEFFTTSKPLSAALEPIIKSMMDDDSGSNIDPGEVFVLVRRHRAGLKTIYKERATEKKKLATAKVVVPAKRDSKGKSKDISLGNLLSVQILDATTGLLTRSLASLPKGSKHWILMLHTRTANSEFCAHHLTISVAGAAAITAHYCQQIAKSFTFLAPPHGSIKIDSDVFQTSCQLEKLRGGGKNLANDFDETLKIIKSENLDSAIIMCDLKYSSKNEMDKIIASAEKESNIRFAFVLFRLHHQNLKCSNTNVLIVYGFDAKVLRIISEFMHGNI